MTNIKLDENDRLLKRKFADQEKIRVFLPSERPFWEGTINGMNLLIPTNEYVDVPRDVARLIEDNAALIKESQNAVKGFCDDLKKIATI